MKNLTIVFFAILTLTIVTSCGKGGRRAAGEAVEYIEKKWHPKPPRPETIEKIKGLFDSEPCSQCGGSGSGYYVDPYGNPLEVDMYGNIIFRTCPSCNGTGKE